MEFPRYPTRREIVIRKLVTCSYYELAKNYAFGGEHHDFWELLYVDKGELRVQTDRGDFELRQGDLLAFEPGQFHAAACNGSVAANVFIVSFECRSPGMNHFRRNRRFRLSDDERGLLASLMEEGDRAFVPNTVRHPGPLLARKPNAPYGSEQLFVTFLETLLIVLIRSAASPENRPPLPFASAEKQEAGLTERIIDYMESHLSDELSVERICSAFSIGKTRLSLLIKKTTGCGVMEYANRLKIEKAKEHIREDNYNFTEIAGLLGYSSVHYFSKQFKKMTGSSPSEYANILKARLHKRL
ncbi:helix-turn-helix domain-containing protein [Paenibacillus flagellatus]|uniref:AraC family transcriptional regulator n=1 Tax=Paenibacillus flagellatus TaxID=2211139 RepID=A0A2V5JWI6_9BACL|nr:helix-turn-helix domain-containing protein [Paenibacillus flagellatus]PYI50552.1 AraC family transcriptional regulator [Paenibacillus flagellatus]